jgi:hypothetical protein
MNNDELKQFQMSRRLLLLANLELLAILHTGGKTALTTSIFTELQIHLELLMDENENIRKKSYDKLATHFHQDDFRLDEAKNTFKDLQKYFTHCHGLHGGQASWTLIFSTKERDKLAKLKAKGKDFF